MRNLCSFLVALAVAVGALAPIPAAGAEKNAKVMIVLDASGSMNGRVDGKPKIIAARKVIAELLKNWDKSIQVGLTAYGHRKKGDCGDIETLVPVGEVDRAAIVRAVDALQPKGKTPLSKAVELAAGEMKYTEERATVILVSDGKETCNADPCAVGAALEKAGVDFTAHVIGFDVTGEEAAGLNCLARNTGGEYITAKNTKALRDALRKTVVKVKQQAAKPVKPKPEQKAASGGGVRLVAVQAEGGEPLKGFGVTWNIFSPKPDASGKYTRHHHYYSAGNPYVAKKVKPGKYILQILSGNLKRNFDVEVTGAAGQEIKVVLNAGVLRTSTIISEGGPKPRFSVTTNVFTSKAGAGGKRHRQAHRYAGKPEENFLLPAGSWLVQAGSGNAWKEAEAEIRAGETTDLTLVLNAGYLRTKTVVTSGGAPPKYSVTTNGFDLEKDANGKYRRVVHRYASEPEQVMLLPKKSYRIQALSGNASGTADVTVRAGETVNVEIPLNAGYLRLSATDSGGGAPRNPVTWNIYLSKKDAQGNRKRVSHRYLDKPAQTYLINAGSYVLFAHGGDGKAEEIPIEIEAGKVTEKTVQLKK